MKLEKKNIIIILCAVSLVATAMTFIQGWAHIQLQWFIGIIILIVVLSGYGYQKEVKVLKLTKIKDNAQNYLRDHDLKDTTKIARIFRRDKIKSDKLWEVVYDGNPTTKVLFDLSGKPVGLELKGTSEPSPLKFPVVPERLHWSSPIRIKKKVEEEIKND